MYYYRLVIDFSHSVERMDFDEFFDKVAEGLLLALDPSLDGAEVDCPREVWISGSDVTAEYDEAYGNGVPELRAELEDENALDAFFRSVQFKDYPIIDDKEA